eukprot:12400186-Karenia_brevis.AAC.1
MISGSPPWLILQWDHLINKLSLRDQEEQERAVAVINRQVHRWPSILKGTARARWNSSRERKGGNKGGRGGNR